MAESLVLTAIDGRGVATLTLNRSQVHNAYNGAMIDALIEAVDALAGDCRLLIVRANGKHFQAGADLAWLREVEGFALEDNLAFSRRTTLAMRALNAFPRPTLALVHGACMYGVHFHPEVVPTPRERALLENSVRRIAGCHGDWSDRSGAAADLLSQGHWAAAACSRLSTGSSSMDWGLALAQSRNTPTNCSRVTGSFGQASGSIFSLCTMAR